LNGVCFLCFFNKNIKKYFKNTENQYNNPIFE
jgi:hypothetical protein